MIAVVASVGPVTPRCLMWSVYNPLDILRYQSTFLAPITFLIAQEDLGVLRKRFLIEVLKCKFNESALDIPKDIRVVVQEHGY